MADEDLPNDLIELKLAFWAAEKLCADISERAVPSDPALAAQQDAELHMARTKRIEIVGKLYAHKWWSQQPNRYVADQKIIAAAKARAAT
jgi:hypothetical protein